MTPREAFLFSVATLTPEVMYAVVPLRDGATVPLRDYQVDLIRRVAAAMRQGYRRVLVVLPTGGGKTQIAAAILAASRGTSQFIVHRKELIAQTSAAFERADIPHSFIAAGYPMSLDADVTIAGVQTLVNRLDGLLPRNLIICDEAHHATARSWDRVLGHSDESFVIGLTATPQRLDGRGLDDHFDTMICGPSTGELIAAGWLSPFDYYAPTTPDLSEVEITAGDFNRAALGDVMDKPAIIGDVVQHYLRLAPGERGIVFAVSREHSRHMAEAFRTAGVRAAHVDGESKDRDEVVGAFRAGTLDVMTNVDLFGEGFDVPGIVYCGLARPTKSLSLFLQQAGRALRPCEGKTRAIICDHAGNATTQGHGLPDDPREWSLEGRARGVRGTPKASDAEPVRTCLMCYRISLSSVPVCPCGAEFPASVREIEQRAGELAKLERETLKRRQRNLRLAQERAARTFGELVSLAMARGYAKPKGWARARMKFRAHYRVPP